MIRTASVKARFEWFSIVPVSFPFTSWGRAQLGRRAHRLGREATQHEGGHPWQRDSVVVDVDADAARTRPRSERSRTETAVVDDRADQEAPAADGGLVVTAARRHDSGVSLLVGVVPA